MALFLPDDPGVLSTTLGLLFFVGVMCGSVRVPNGSLVEAEQRLWKARFVGLEKYSHGGMAATILEALWRVDREGSEM